MRRLKAIYFIIAFLVLLIGAACASYYLMVVPQMEQTKKARADWEAAREACHQAEGGYQASIDKQVAAAEKLYKGYKTFVMIQGRMPQLYSLKDMYPTADKTSVAKYWELLSRPTYENELNRWMRGFHLPNPVLADGKPFAFNRAAIGFQQSLTMPGAQVVKVDFGPQTITGYGMADLLGKLRRFTGYSNYPLIIAPTTVAAAKPKPEVQEEPVEEEIPQPGMSQAEAEGHYAGETLDDGTFYDFDPETGQLAHLRMVDGEMVRVQDGPAAGGAAMPGAAPMPGAPGAAPAGAGAMNIVLDTSAPYNPKKPKLKMQFTASAYFMTRGWNPKGDVAAAQDEMMQAKVLYENPPKMVPPRTQFDNGPCPPILWVLEPQGIEL